MGTYITAAFRTSQQNEAYIFMKNEFIREDYAPNRSDDKIIQGPMLIRDGFQSLRGTIFGEIGIDCAFGSHEMNEAFIFSGKLCAKINYEKDQIIRGPTPITNMFPCFKGKVFENGIDAGFEISSVKYEAYIFKGDHYARINYGSASPCVMYYAPIRDAWGCIVGTPFENGIDAAFALHFPDEAYLFKGDSYARIKFAPGAPGDRIVAGVTKINRAWNALGSLLPRKDYGIHIHTYKTKGYIHAAFRSSYKDEAYIFFKNEYVLNDYAPGRTNDKILGGPVAVGQGYPSLKGTVFGDHGIDCAFGSHDTNQAFVFSGNICAKINYAPHSANDKILKGPITIADMFPFFKGTVFESGVDAAFQSSIQYEAYLFKGNQCARINYGNDSHFLYILPISQMFHGLKDTMFEHGLDAAFALHLKDQAYLFKGDSYVRFNFAPATSNDHIMGGVGKIKNCWTDLARILPYKNYGHI